MDYIALQGDATELIKEFGRRAVFVRKEQGAYNAATGRVSEATPVEYPVTLVTLEYSAFQRDGSNILAGDVKALMSGGEKITPVVGDMVKIDGVLWRVIDPKPLAPGGVTVLYELQLRRG